MAKPRVALAFPARIEPHSFFGFLLPALGLERLGAAIEDIATAELFDARFERDLAGAVAASRPDVVAINVKTTLYANESYALARRLRELVPAAKLVMGGLHATACPEEALEHADYVIRGDGEGPFRRLVAGEPPADIAGLAYHGPEGPVLNAMERVDSNMDGLAPPARHLRKPGYEYSAAGLIKMDLLETSQGCTFACSFCSPASVYPCVYRYHSPAYVMEEVRRLGASGVKYCMLTDDHFGGDFQRTEQLCDLIVESGIRMAFFCFIRPFAGHMELKKKMVAAGFVLLSYGAESPSRSQLKRYGKGYPATEDFIKTVNAEWLEAGACYIGNSYVFGDVKDSADTLAVLGIYARHLDPTYIEPLYSQPYPGTRYRQELETQGLLRDRDWSDFTEARLLVNHPTLDEAGMRRLRMKMWLDFFTPRKAAGIFRVPLYLHHHVGLSALTVVRYMKACEYAVFGCILEHKLYRDMQVEMVRDYFRKHLPTFEPEEMSLDELCHYFDDFASMLWLGWLKRLLGTTDVVATVLDGPATLACLAVGFEGGHVVRARALAGPCEPSAERRTLTIAIPLGLVAHYLGARSRVVKLLAMTAMIVNVLLFDLPRRALGRVGRALG